MAMAAGGDAEAGTGVGAVAGAGAPGGDKLEVISSSARLLLAEDCLSLVVVLATELPRPAGRGSAREALRREVVHRLASSECTHSEVATVASHLSEVRNRGKGGGGAEEGGGYSFVACLSRLALIAHPCLDRASFLLLINTPPSGRGGWDWLGWGASCSHQAAKLSSY